MNDCTIGDTSVSQIGMSQLNMSSSSSNDLSYIPQVRHEKIPKIGQEFESLDEAQKFYNDYAREAGFSVRMWTTNKNKSNEVVRKEFVCYKEGTREKGEVKSDGSRRRGTTREGCKAKLAVVKSSSKQSFMVSSFCEVHNHLLTTPRKVHLLRSHRSMSKAKKALTQQLSAANVPIHQQISILELEAGSLENIGCIEKDFYNARRDEVKLFAGHDAQMLVEYFQAEKEKNSEFYFSVDVDEENKITHCFWADMECRKAYQTFGDVVVFDTTYNTNRYGMIFAPFVGVNHHGQTILFACAFLNDETTESFRWILKQLLIAMPIGPPKMIITDQDPAMGKAIVEVLPNTVHRFCMWHILSKFSEKLDALKWKDHYPQFHRCIWNSESQEEFDVKWAEVIEQSGLQTNEWLKALYDIRSKWIPAYVNDTFSAGMSTSQRAESCHAFFKCYVSKKNTLMDFVVRFTRAIRRQRHQELSLDHKDINEQPVTKTMWPIEKSMAELYTQTMFYKVQDELFQSMAYMAKVDCEIGNMCYYIVQRVDGSQSCGRKVIENKSLNYMTCSCRKFESNGFPCRHIFSAFSKIQVQQPLPDIYVLRRWTKSAKSLTVGGVDGRGDCDGSVVLKHNILRKQASDIIEVAMLNEEIYKLTSETFDSLQSKINSMTLNDDGQSSTPSMALSQQIYNDPEKVRAKGCGKRLKGGKEIAAKKNRRCHGCGLTGQAHDKRNCPALNNISSQPNNYEVD